MRVLFFGEPATLAHVARPVVLAAGLRDMGLEVSLATGPDFRWIADRAGLPVHAIDCIGTQRYLKAVDAGAVVFPFDVLDRYVRDDLRVMEEVRPDVVVGDFRLSLAVSARLASIPYCAVVNAYWSPDRPWRPEIPVHPSTRLLGPTIAGTLFRPLAPLILAHHAMPMHRLRKAYGMKSLGLDLRAVFSEGDVSVFPDIPELVPVTSSGSPGRYQYIGPVVWSAPADLPRELANRSERRPLVYLALGSSGNRGALALIIEALQGLDVDSVIAVGEGNTLRITAKNMLVARYLPGDQVAGMASVVICNGGSPTSHQALGKGCPVLGIPSNLDQLLNMQCVERVGAGLSIRADALSVKGLQSALVALLEDASYSEAAKRIATLFAAYDPVSLIGDALAMLSAQHATLGA